MQFRNVKSATTVLSKSAWPDVSTSPGAIRGSAYDGRTGEYRNDVWIWKRTSERGPTRGSGLPEFIIEWLARVFIVSRHCHTSQEVSWRRWSLQRSICESTTASRRGYKDAGKIAQGGQNFGDGNRRFALGSRAREIAQDAEEADWRWSALSELLSCVRDRV